MASCAGGWRCLFTHPPLARLRSQGPPQQLTSRRVSSLQQQQNSVRHEQHSLLQRQHRLQQQQQQLRQRIVEEGGVRTGVRGTEKASGICVSFRRPLEDVFGKLKAPFCGARAFASGAAKSTAAPAPLSRNVEMKEILSPRWVVEPPNYLRRPLWRQWWEAQFANRSFFFFGNAWTSAASFAAFLWWSRVFDPPPKERLDRYWLNSPKFRILSAFHNPGKRPGLKISLMTYEARYCYRGLDHPFTINELKDFLFKLREQHLVNYFQGIQFPFVFRQYNRVRTPATLELFPGQPQGCGKALFLSGMYVGMGLDGCAFDDQS